ncbi:MAG: helix-turn-helix transcriptional regulator [Pseudomonadota bacterium]
MPEPDRILRLDDVLYRCGLSRSTIYRKINEGTFPQQVRVGLNSVGWLDSEVSRWIANPMDYRPLVEVAA